MANKTITFEQGAELYRHARKWIPLIAEDVGVSLRDVVLKDADTTPDYSYFGFLAHDGYLRAQMRTSFMDEKKRRDIDDHGPLRIVTGMLLRSFFGGTESLPGFWPLDEDERSRVHQDEGYFSSRLTGRGARVSWGTRTWFAHVIEFGAQKRRAYAPFRNAVSNALPVWQIRSRKIVHTEITRLLWGQLPSRSELPLTR